MYPFTFDRRWNERVPGIKRQASNRHDVIFFPTDNWIKTGGGGEKTGKGGALLYKCTKSGNGAVDIVRWRGKGFPTIIRSCSKYVSTTNNIWML